MSEDDRIALQQRLDALIPLLPLIDWKGIQGSPSIRQLLEQVVTTLGDADRLEAFGYFTIDQACTKICDVFQEGKLPRTKVFSHCGTDHPCHVLQNYITCPICKTRSKMRGLFGEDDIEGVASLALHWLRIDHRSIPDWNPE